MVLGESLLLYGLGAGAAAALGLPALKSRLELSRAKHPSLAGHARLARRVAALVPGYGYGEERFFRADDAQALQQTYAEIDRLETTPRADVRYTDYEDLYPWLLLPAAVALALELLLRRGPLLEFAS